MRPGTVAENDELRSARVFQSGLDLFDSSVGACSLGDAGASRDDQRRHRRQAGQ